MIYGKVDTWFPERNPKNTKEDMKIIPNKVIMGVTKRRCTIVPYSFVQETLELISDHWKLDLKNAKDFKTARKIMVRSVLNN